MKTTITAILIVFLFIIGNPQDSKVQAQSVQGSIGAMTDNTPAPLFTPPCTTFGYSVDTFTDLPSGFNAGIFAAVDNVNRRLYVMTQGGGSDFRLCVLALSDLTNQGCLTLTNPSEIVQEANFEGVVNSSGEFWFFHRKPNGTGCTPVFPGNPCVGTRLFNGPAQSADVDFLAVDAGNLDALQIDEGTQLAWLKHVNELGVRSLSIFNASTQSLVLKNFGAPPDPAGGGLITIDEANDLVYGFDNSGNAIWRTPQAAASFTSLGLSIGASRQYINIAQDNDRVGVVTDNAVIPGLGQWVDKSTFDAPSRQTVTFATADGGAGGEPTESYQIFFDNVNSSYHSLRENGATNFIRRLAVGPATGNVTLASDVLLASAGNFTNVANSAAFSSDFASIYLINRSTPARVFKISVCATGGP